MSTHPVCPAARAAVTLAVLALAGCGGAATPEPASPATAPGMTAEVASAPPPSASPDDAAVDLDRAEAELLAALGQPQQRYAQAPGASPQAGAAQPAQPAPAPPPTSATPSVDGASPKSAQRAETSSASPCTTACRALASMERAAEHLCDLSGSDDTRCDSARARVKSATERVYAQCPSCAQ